MTEINYKDLYQEVKTTVEETGNRAEVRCSLVELAKVSVLIDLFKDNISLKHDTGALTDSEYENQLKIHDKMYESLMFADII